jgi:hypothetical protein
MAEHWEQLYDEASGHYYYRNSVTGESAWDMPSVAPPVQKNAEMISPVHGTGGGGGGHGEPAMAASPGMAAPPSGQEMDRLTQHDGCCAKPGVEGHWYLDRDKATLYQGDQGVNLCGNYCKTACCCIFVAHIFSCKQEYFETIKGTCCAYRSGGTLCDCSKGVRCEGAEICVYCGWYRQSYCLPCICANIACTQRHTMPKCTSVMHAVENKYEEPLSGDDGLPEIPVDQPVCKSALCCCYAGFSLTNCSQCTGDQQCCCCFNRNCYCACNPKLTCCDSDCGFLGCDCYKGFRCLSWTEKTRTLLCLFKGGGACDCCICFTGGSGCCANGIDICYCSEQVWCWSGKSSVCPCLLHREEHKVPCILALLGVVCYSPRGGCHIDCLKTQEERKHMYGLVSPASEGKGSVGSNSNSAMNSV